MNHGTTSETSIRPGWMSEESHLHHFRVRQVHSFIRCPLSNHDHEVFILAKAPFPVYNLSTEIVNDLVRPSGSAMLTYTHARESAAAD